MNRGRRKFLLTGALAVSSLLAGCTESEEIEGGDHSGDNRDTNTPTMTTEPTNTPTMTPTSTTTSTATPTPTPTRTPEKEPSISIESSELKKRETSYQTEAYIIATIKNNGNGASGEIRAKGRFYDENDNLLDSTSTSLHYLKPGEVWECYLPYFDDGNKVKSHTLDGDFETVAPRFEIDGLSVADTKLNKGDYSATITGTIKNNLTEDADFLRALARFWRDDKILANGLANITDVPAGENWSFEADYMGYGSRWEDANGHDVVPEVTIY
ncbi:FxLYD domain-containing protein [Haloferax volcanii]|uniref:FxLYD domain-containing protein n=1 Tax=Haloferax volcanii TaxID=2246 RepID=UPI0023DBBC51|nr:FxLYD domain-containing protein [Haloferax lucentense]WEL26502.1 S-layer protein [Haloferax lucentense]